MDHEKPSDDAEAAAPVRIPRTSKPLEAVALVVLLVMVAFAGLWGLALVVGVLNSVP